MAKILIVEDDQFLRDLYNELLTEAGYEITLAQDGEEGLEKASVGGFDLVLLDIMLPKMDGLEVLRRLKENKPKFPNGPVVLLTNLGQDAIIKEGFSLGATGYIIKSAMTPDQVLDEVKVFLKQN
jgi:CheY-like chemotaxis protein